MRKPIFGGSAITSIKSSFRLLGAVLGESRFLVLLFTFLGFCLRLAHVVVVSPFVDEYISIWAARKILEQGIPLLAAGTIYDHGLLFSYLDALFLGLLGMSETVARFPTLLVSTLTIPLAFLLGRRLLSPGAGLLAALLLALDPGAVVWGGRARMYPLLQFFVLLAILFFYEGDIDPQRMDSSSKHVILYHYLFVLSYLGALLSQAVATLLFPLFLLLALWRRGLRWFRRPVIFFGFSLCFLGIALQFLFDRMGPPAMTKVGVLTFVIRHRPFIDPSVDIQGLMKSLQPFLNLPYLPFTIVFLAGFLYLVWSFRPFVLFPTSQKPGMVFLYLLFMGVMLEIFLLVGESWKSPRFIFMLTPVFFAAAGAWLDRVIRWVAKWLKSPRAEPVFNHLLLVFLLLFLLPPARVAATKQTWGYDLAFRYVRDHRQPRDLVMTINLGACAFYFGSCDFLAVERGFEGYVVNKDGVWVEGWDETPILDSVEQMQEVLEGKERVWFVVDGWRFRDRYTPAFRALVEERMELVFEGRGVFVFLKG